MPLGIHNPVVSLKPRRGRSWKRMRRIEIAVELEKQFVPDAQIAQFLGITLPALHQIKLCPEYLAKRMTQNTSVLSILEQNALENEEAQKEFLNSLVPAALHATKRILFDPNHPAYAKVALDVLDRQRSTSKISRTEHSVAKAIDTAEQDAKALKLLEMLDLEDRPKLIEAPQPSPEPTPVIGVTALAQTGADTSLAEDSDLDDLDMLSGTVQ